MTKGTNQGVATNSVPVWLDVQPSTTGPWPTNKNVSGGATLVYEVAAPANTPPYPNNQGTAVNGVNQGATPIRIVAQPTAGLINSNDPNNALSATPVFVIGSDTGILAKYPNSKWNTLGAIPVYLGS